jgi:hypothetical protein
MLLTFKVFNNCRLTISSCCKRNLLTTVVDSSTKKPTIKMLILLNYSPCASHDCATLFSYVQSMMASVIYLVLIDFPIIYMDLALPRSMIYLHIISNSFLLQLLYDTCIKENLSSYNTCSLLYYYYFQMVLFP